MNEQKNEEIEIDLLEIFYLLRSKIAIILVATVVAALAAGLISKFMIAPQYASTSKLYVLTKSTSVTSFADIQVGSSLTADYMELINSRPVIEAVIKNLGLDAEPYDETYESMVEKINVTNPEDTRILAITVTYDSPEMAKKIVDNVAMVSKTSISKIMDQDEPNIIEEGYANPMKVSPNVKKNAALAGIAVAFLVMLIIVVRFLLDDTIKSSEDIEKYLELNTLALIPFKEEEDD
nr:polysaccharide export protein [Eubacterium sp.]